jgi:hypothetical protein
VLLERVRAGTAEAAPLPLSADDPDPDRAAPAAASEVRDAPDGGTASDARRPRASAILSADDRDDDDVDDVDPDRGLPSGSGTVRPTVDC